MLTPGEILLDRYRVEKLVGVGGMSLVFQARDIERDERVAVKLLRGAFQNSGERFDPFGRESNALTRLTHPNILRVLNADTLASGVPFMVTDLLIGRDLHAELAERGPLPFPEVAAYIWQSCQALQYAHEQAIIHRDIKPSNLFLTGLDDIRKVTVLDFGISKLLVDADGTTTMTSQAMGTPQYMSPEQIRAKPGIDGRSDIWALGVTMYHAITGHSPFKRATPSATIAAIPVEEPPLPSTMIPELPIALEMVILRCMRKDPGDRFQSMSEFADALAPFMPDGGLVRIPGAKRVFTLPPVTAPTDDFPPRPGVTKHDFAEAGTKPIHGVPSQAAPSLQTAAHLHRKPYRSLPWVLSAVAVSTTLVFVLVDFKKDTRAIGAASEKPVPKQDPVFSAPPQLQPPASVGPTEPARPAIKFRQLSETRSRRPNNPAKPQPATANEKSESSVDKLNPSHL